MYIVHSLAKKHNIVFWVLCLLIMFTSCVNKKDILYLQDVEKLNQNVDVQRYKTIVRPNDLLNVLVSSYDLDAVRPFNLSPVAPDQIGMGQGNTSQQGQSYLVDSEGNIEFPVLGKLKVSGASRIEVVQLLKDRISEYVKDPIVNVRISNYKVTVLGEVSRPGTFTIPDERITILDAIGLAGDMTIYGKRSEILIVRETEKGNKIYEKLDIRSADIFKSDFFYLQQNDVVIVAPNKAQVKQAGVNSSTSLYFSIASLLVGIATLVLRFN